MLRATRYALATVCFAAGVGCLALWWRSMSHSLRGHAPLPGVATLLHIDLWRGVAKIEFPDSDNPFYGSPDNSKWGFESFARTDSGDVATRLVPMSFGETYNAIGVYFPLWYLALIFALAGVGVLRFRRQFSIRTALVGLSVVAALLGMVVIL